jgi:hypothetical protein
MSDSEDRDEWVPAEMRGKDLRQDCEARNLSREDRKMKRIM